MREARVRSAVGKLLKGHRFRVLVILLVLVVVGLGIVMAPIERRSSESLIRTEWDGVYFAMTTVTGVGYGDLVPVTSEGKVLAMVLMTVGVVLFGSIVALVSIELMRYQENYYVRRLLTRIDEMEARIEELKKHVDYLVKK